MRLRARDVRADSRWSGADCGATLLAMPEYLLVLEGRNAAHHYILLVEDVLLRRLGARRLLRSAFVLEAGSAASVYDSIRTWTPCTDGVLVLPFPADDADRFARNLREPVTSLSTAGAHGSR
jgi:hypothetical protein